MKSALYQPYPRPSEDYEVFRRLGQVDNTKIGLLLLIIGAMIAWVPFIGAVGTLVALIGALFVILGRKAFGREHNRNVVVSVSIFIVGTSVTIVGAVIVFLGTLLFESKVNPNPVLPSTVFTLYIIGGAITGLSRVLFTYALQRTPARVLLWLGYVASIIVSIFRVLVAPILPALYSNSPMFTLPGLFLLNVFLGAIPAFLFGAAFYLARNRILRQEIPTPLGSSTITPEAR